MHIHPTDIPGAFVIEPERIADERGFFARTWDRQLAAQHGMATALEQCSVSFNQRAGTLRGMHWQAAPFGETKLVRCTSGAIHDVIVDLRPDSPSHLRQLAVELTANNRLLLYIPEGCAHGFQTLTDETEVSYQMSQFYSGPHARAAHYRSPAFQISWPLPVTVISARDEAAPPYLQDG